MANLNIEVPDDLARSLEGIAAAQRKSIQELPLERLISLVEDIPEIRAGTPSAGPSAHLLRLTSLPREPLGYWR